MSSSDPYPAAPCEAAQLRDAQHREHRIRERDACGGAAAARPSVPISSAFLSARSA